MINTAAEKYSDLRNRWEAFLLENPQVKIRDAAHLLATTELELLTTRIGESVVRLKDNFDELLKEFHALGRVMALTRNDAIVHERKGEYLNVEVFEAHGKMGLVLGEDIDLRIFFKNWQFGFAVINQTDHGVQRSFQFFDASGTAVHKVFLTDKGDLETYEKLVAEYKSGDQSQQIDVAAKASKIVEKLDAEIDIESFRKAWAEMKDTHDFFGMTRKFGVSRLQALRLADEQMAIQVGTESYQSLLETAAAEKLPIMIFVNNIGIIQIHTGEIENVRAARGWFNVLDEKFNLHIKEDRIGSVWVVRKPTNDGIVSSVELFDKDGENVALIFGKRKPGEKESTEWRNLLAKIEM